MKAFILDILRIIRPFGLRRLVVVVVILLAQVLAQLAAIFALLPFLQAAADIDGFRASFVGSTLMSFTGDLSDESLIATTGAAALIFLIAGNLVSLYADYSRARYAHEVGHWLRMRLLQNLLARRYEYFLQTNSSLLMKNLVEDVGVFAQGILGSILDILARIALTLILSVALLIFEPAVFVGASLLVIAYYFAVMRPLRRRAARASANLQTAVRSLYFQINQLLTGIKPVLAGDRSAFFVNKNEAASARVSEIMPLVPLYAAIPKSGLEIAVFGGLIVWVLSAISLGQDIIELIPTVGLIAVIAYRLMPSLQFIFSQSMSIVGQRQSMDEVVHFLRAQIDQARPGSLPPTDRDNLPAPLAWHDELRFENVVFAYRGADTPAIRDVSFGVRKGERVAFVGETGCGKSTLIDLIMGLLHPQSGAITVDGQPLEGERLDGWRQAVGYVPQELFLIDGSIADNIAFGAQGQSLDMARVTSVAEMAQARGFIEGEGKLGFETVVGERGVRLSGGERQRLALARALFTRPNFLVLDEATSALDPATERRLVDQLSQADDEITFVSVTHRLGTVREYDRIYYIESGMIVAEGTFAELIATHAGFRAFSEHA